ncbi:unnamed protein product [Nezara viridula]|uniref:Major facilitator superfamily (MFS) profile domain-containing protein n=1 Tax=Nezara viridula TaxID=85310 RepID=A0A9P0HAK3_NEZVI|nr:unnamed protein product [Nezara viridula]
MSIYRKPTVPLEEALNIAGTGLYTNYVTITTGAIYFCALLSCQAIAIVIPAIGCDLKLSNSVKGAMASMTFTGKYKYAYFIPDSVLENMYAVFRTAIRLLGGQFRAEECGTVQSDNDCILVDSLRVNAQHSNHDGHAVPQRFCVSLSIENNALRFLLAKGQYLGHAESSNVLPIVESNKDIIIFKVVSLTGVLTPAYVYVSEFTALKDRAKALVALTAIGALANVYLPGMAWLIMPLDINIHIIGDMRFTSWRLFIIHLIVPILLSTALLWNLPESPKFLMSQGKAQETVDVLKSVFALNNNRRKESFPVLSICLDADDLTCAKVESSGNQFINYFKMMMSQTCLLFSKKYIFYTLLCIALLFGVVGGFNSLFLWFPDEVSRIRHYSQSHDEYNVTLCDIMSSRRTVQEVPNCQLNYSFFAANIILGSTQFITCLISSVAAEKIGRKLYLMIATSISSLICFSTIFITNEYLTIGSLGMMTLLLYLAFPVTVSVMVEFFPTPLRSTATSIIMVFGRLGATVGSQMMGVLYANYCEEGYVGMTLILAG